MLIANANFPPPPHKNKTRNRKEPRARRTTYLLVRSVAVLMQPLHRDPCRCARGLSFSGENAAQHFLSSRPWKKCITVHFKRTGCSPLAGRSPKPRRLFLKWQRLHVYRGSAQATHSFIGTAWDTWPGGKLDIGNSLLHLEQNAVRGHAPHHVRRILGLRRNRAGAPTNMARSS